MAADEHDTDGDPGARGGRQCHGIQLVGTAYTAPAEFEHVTLAAPAEPVPLHPHAIREQASVPVGDEVVGGFVYAPPVAGPHPAIVFIHGAGTKDHTGFDEQTEYLARAGVVALVIDKRTAEYSPWHRDYVGMADDVLAGVSVLRSRPDVDPALVGLFAESDCTWVAPVAAAQDADIAFTIMVSAPIVAPAQQATYATLMAFDGLDVPELVNRAVAKCIGTALSLPNVLDYAQFDVLPWLAETTQPMLMVYGTEDPALPLIQAADLARSVAGGEVTVRYFDGAQHAIRIGHARGPFAPGYLDALAAWIAQRTAAVASGPDIAGGQSAQTLSADAAPGPPWYATAFAHVSVLALAIVGHLAGPGWTELAGAALRWIRSLGLASVGNLVAYYAGLSYLALNQLTNPVMIYGVWALVWIITGTAVAALLNLGLSNTWRRSPVAVMAAGGSGEVTVAEGDPGTVGSAPRMTIVEAIALAGAVAGTGLFLLVVTYWGVFLGI